jgi:hypothetical protein
MTGIEKSRQIDQKMISLLVGRTHLIAATPLWS